jgi:glycerate kinase
VRVLIAADKFKGALSAAEACAAIGRGVERVLAGEALEIECLPVADGGEGTAETVLEACGGEWVACRARDALGRPVDCGYALLADGDGAGKERKTAVIEMSQASGLWRLEAGELAPRIASTFGTGELIRNAVGRGAGRLIVGIGGSATNDAGTGMGEALGYRFYDECGGQLEGLPQGVERLGRIERPEPVPLDGIEVSVACDVRNPLLGPSGATRIYGPQKGVKEEDFGFFENRLGRVATVAARDLGTGEAAELAGAGAAGGLGFGLLVFGGAALRPGFELVADVIGIEERIAAADLVITGEGRIDGQTAQGKAPGGVAGMAREAGKPVLAVGGAISLEGEDRELVAETFDMTLSIEEVFPGVPLAERIARNGELLEESIAKSPEVMKKFAAGGLGV